MNTPNKALILTALNMLNEVDYDVRNTITGVTSEGKKINANQLMGMLRDELGISYFDWNITNKNQILSTERR